MKQSRTSAIGVQPTGNYILTATFIHVAYLMVTKKEAQDARRRLIAKQAELCGYSKSDHKHRRELARKFFVRKVLA